MKFLLTNIMIYMLTLSIGYGQCVSDETKECHMVDDECWCASTTSPTQSGVEMCGYVDAEDAGEYYSAAPNGDAIAAAFGRTHCHQCDCATNYLQAFDDTQMYSSSESACWNDIDRWNRADDGYGATVVRCANLEQPTSITLWSQGTEEWPDQACNPNNSFGGCNTNDQEHADAWATWVCENNGYESGVWTGNKEAGCNGEVSMYCQNSIPCNPYWEDYCQEGDQTKVEITCFGEGYVDDCPSGIYDCAGVCDGEATEDCAGECGGLAVEDECGVCGGENYCADDQGGDGETVCDAGEASEVISSLPYSTTVNTLGADNTFGDYCGTDTPDYLLEFEVTEPTYVDITLCGTWNDYQIDAMLYVAQADSECFLTELAYDDDHSGGEWACGNGHSLDSGLDNLYLDTGLYYIVVERLCGDYSNGGDINFHMQYSDGFASSDTVIDDLSEKLGREIDTTPITADLGFNNTNTRDCDFVEGPDAGCDGVCFSEAVADDCGVCDGDNSTCEDCAGVPGGDAELDECGFCEGDGTVGVSFDVTDVVVLVEAILDELWSSDELYCSDLDGSGSLDIVDVVMMVETILGSSRIADATDVTLTNNGRSLALESNGFIGGIQMTLTHSSEFAMELTESAMVADYRTNGNQTVVIIAAPEAGDLFTTNSEFLVEDIVAQTTSGELEVSVNLPLEFGLSAAYPNPFNPSTSFDVYMSNTEAISVGVYNVMGQLVYTIHSGELTSGKYTFNWDASNVSSGVYFIKATTSSNVATQKVMLMK